MHGAFDSLPVLPYVRPIRILVGTMPGVLRDILLGVITAESDLEYAGQALADETLAMAAERSAADLVIVGREDASLSHECRELLLSPIDVKTLAISDYGRAGFLFEVVPHPARLADMQPRRLADAIRAAAHASDGRP